ncbi:GDSL esterase/lipase At2g40250 isoform X1 [Ricinus communis]|uniref:GDSL esterase/lipase At2g40250 isoform X1 n=1 Tax=Ricinus communis TaxID=3988 RepID=UPI00201AC049|nr:GDSL esterase/lipase At2g40250 isoform X1 [Ricinus communis]
MDFKTTINILKLFLSTAFFLSLTTASSSKIFTSSTSNITAIFGFGDSTIDTGNNNYIPTDTRSNYPPYGRDFPFRIPTGRFSNGKLPIDLITASLGLKRLLPPYLKPLLTSFELPTGASFGSAGSGLDPLTSQAANVLSMPDQISLFDQALSRIRRLKGQERAEFIVKNALFFFSIGTNDFTNYYNTRQRADEFNISGYQDFILKRYEDAIRSLYNRGARRFAVTGLWPVGCLPIQITINNITNPRRCVEAQNIDSIAYNVKLRELATALEIQLQGSRIAFYEQYASILDMINNPATHGFEETLRGCCGTGLFEFGTTCTPTTPTCPDASKFLFWDAVHPTLAAYIFLANMALDTVIPDVAA